MSSEDRLKVIWEKACQLCARQEKAPSQVLRKLQSYGATEAEADELLERLKRDNFVNEERFVRAYVSDKFRFNKWGKIKIAYHLRQLGFADDLIEGFLLTIDLDAYEDVALQLAQAKFNKLGTLKNLLHRQQKTIDFLRNKGFEFDLAKKIVTNLSIREQS